MARIAKALIALSLCTALLFTLCACSQKKKTKSPSQTSEELCLPFCSSDATDPYACKTQTNLLLSELVYESLFTIAPDRSVVPKLAESYTLQDNTITVKLADVKFSDGSAVTSGDVVQSFSLAKQSAAYRAMLADFDSAQKKGTGVVRFILNEKNCFALSLLTFPIVKLTDNRIGTGMYQFQEKDGTAFLEYNKYNRAGKPKIETFALCECKDYSNAVGLFNDGKIDYLFDMLTDGNLRSNALNSAKAKLNNLLFLGINAKRGICKNIAFRNALSLATDQTALCEEALMGFAVATATPFDPDWKEIGAVVSNSVLGKESEAKEAFLQAGCSYDKMDINLLWNEEPISLSLIVNSANNMKIALAEQIKAQLVGYGIGIDIKKMPLDEYNIAVENENFDLYIGEVKMLNDFNLNCFFSEDGGADFGINAPALSKTYRQFKSGSASLQDFVSLFSEVNPFIPIGYKCADVCCNASLKTSGVITENEKYPVIEEWSR